MQATARFRFPIALLVLGCGYLVVGCGGGGGGGFVPPPVPAPTVTAIVCDRGGTPGGRAVTITGTGFVDNMAGANTVTIGGAPLVAPVIVNDTTITGLTPPAAPGPMDVEVTNNNGTGTLVGGYTYVVPVLYAADGRGGGNVAGCPPGFPGPALWRIDLTGGGAHVNIGPLDGGVTSLALAPDGTMYGAGDFGTDDDAFITVNLATGQGTLVGSTGLPPGNPLSGMTFSGTTCIARAAARDTEMLYTINTATGVATPLAAGPVERTGNGLAADCMGNVWMATAPGGGGTTPVLFSVNPATGVSAPIGPITGLSFDRVPGLAFLDGVLWCLDIPASGGAGAIGTLDTTTAAFTPLFAVPLCIDAIEGSVK
jgi:hypothetical protein